MAERNKLQSLPLLPLKNAVLYPRLVIPLTAGRPASVAAINAAMATADKKIVVIAQRDAEVETPGADDLYSIGTEAVIKRLSRNPDGVEFLVQGLDRVVLLKVDEKQPEGYLQARVRPLPMPEDGGPEIEALERAVAELAQRVLDVTEPQVQLSIEQFIREAGDPLWLAFMAGSLLSIDLPKRQTLLEVSSRIEALRLVHGYLTHELQVLELRQKIAKQAASEASKEQREYMLRQQLRAIQQELGEKDADKASVESLRLRLQEAELPDEVRKEAERELTRLERMPPAAPDYQLTTSYIELILELPWRRSTQVEIDLKKARQILDEDHYDLDDVKGRILEYLAVMKLNPKAHAPILCFVGPPGVGKTSLGQSIARSVGRKFERMSLGGLHDEAELRGHRRTYIGSMPGRIIQAIRRASVNNPLLMLDEVDKLGRDFRGDPASALLEILDPAQNFSFRDNYLDLPFDLSNVFFITTANSTDNIPRPLLDRMELITLDGYSQEQKIEIAHRYLIPRQVREAGLSVEQLSIPDDALNNIIARYTREAGVRDLERAVARLARKAAQRVAEGNSAAITIAVDDLPDLLGPERHLPERARKQLPPGVATGLAWTEFGGEVLYIEATLLPDGKGLRLTGSLGQVMRESAEAAQSFVWAHAEELGVDPHLFKSAGIHVHVPAGAVPKDGPSAGVAMVTALASLYTKLPVIGDTAMTGEITLAGLVLPVGGLKQKILAARRAGIRRIILPAENKKDLRDLPDCVRRDVEFVFAERIEQVLEAAIPMLTQRLRTLAGTTP